MTQIPQLPPHIDVQDDDLLVVRQSDNKDHKVPVAALSKGNVRYVQTIDDLRAVNGMQDGQAVEIVSTGRAGLFRWDAGDLSAEVLDKPYDYIAPNSDPSGAGGAWALVGYEKPLISGSLPQTSNSTKMLVRIAQYPVSIGTVPSRVYVVTAGFGGRDYLLYELRRGFTTTTGSIGGSGELLRVTSVFRQSVAWVGRHAAGSTSGSWVETQYTPAGTTTKFSSPALEAIDKYWYLTGGSGGEHIEFNVPFNSSHEANLQFLMTPASAQDVEISIDGGAPEVVNLSAPTPTIYRHRLRATPGFHTVRITAPSASAPVHVFGSNYEDVKDAGRFQYIGGFVTWGGEGKYTSGEGANDYAILDDESGLFGGSFHGGETLIDHSLLVDGVSTPIQAAPIIGRVFQIEQSTKVDWSGHGGGQLSVRTSHDFDRDGGYRLDSVFDGDVRSGTFYCAMHTTPTEFGDVIFPVVRDLSQESDGFKVFPKCDMLVQQETSSRRRVYVKQMLVGDRGNVYGGPALRKVSGSYNKFYYGPAINGEVQKFTNLVSSTVKLFT